MESRSLPRLVYPFKGKVKPRTVGFSKHSLRFTGGGDLRVIVPGLNGYNYANGITFMCWVYAFSFINWQIGIYQKNAAGNRIFQIQISPAGVPRLNTNIGGVWYPCSSGVTLVAMRWYHLVGTYDNDIQRIYVNGVFKNSDDTLSGALGVLDDDLQVGISDLIYEFNGLLDGIMVYDRPLSLHEINYDVLNYHNPIRSGLMLWLPLEEGAGLTAYDYSGLGNNGSLLPALTPPTWRRNRKWELRAEGDLAV